MSHSKHGAGRGPNPLIFVILALIIIAAALVVIILVVRSAPPEEPQSEVSLPKLEEPIAEESVKPEETEASVPAAPVEETTAEQMEIQENPQGDVWVETPYCNLVYPFEMSDTLRVESKSVGEGLTVTFYGGINDLEEALYAVHFGVEAGFPVGTLSAEDGTEVSVWADVFEIVPGDSWQEDEINTLYAMQECVNDTLEYLQNEAGFTAAE